MTPERIGQYELVEQLGAGAYGTAFYAVDTLLKRPVVVKLPRAAADAGVREQLLEEARIASALDHPNVCAIYEVGEAEGRPYIVMQYVQGTTLGHLLRAGALELRFTLSVGIQLAAGLAAAHRLGILHRDLKPDNVMITGDGVAKLLDFGLARRGARGADEPTGMAGRPGGEAASERFGTTAYMAPEQLELRRSSEQSDIFALGVMLYQMTTGRHPFLPPGADPSRVAAAIRTHQPAPPSAMRPGLPPEVDAVVLRAIAKQPANRFRYAQDVGEALKELMRSLQLETGVVPGEASAVLPAPAAEPRERRGLLSGLVDRFRAPRPAGAPAGSIAVVPFQDLDAPERPGLVGFALSNAVATRLARVPELAVRPLSAYLSVSERTLDAVEAARQVQAEQVLLASYTRARETFILQWQLLEVASRALRSGGTVRVDSTELAVLQDRVADGIFSELLTSGKLREPSAPAAPGTALEELPDEVQEEYLEARALLAAFALRGGTQEDLDRVLDAYRRVVERAPSFAPAHAGLGTAFLRSARNGFGGVDDLRTAERHLSRALELDPELVEARLYRASTLIWAGEKERARLELQSLLGTTPPDADVYLAAAVILQLDGLLDEALRLQGLALRLNPSVGPRAYYYRARIHIFQRRLDAARLELDKGLAIEPGHTLLRHVLGFLHFQQGDLEGATATLESVIADAASLRIAYPTLAMCYARAGRTAEAEALITEEVLDAAAADAETAYRVATYHAVVGRAEEALAWLRRAVFLGNENYPWFAANPDWEPLRDHPELRQILTDLAEVHRVNRVRWGGVLGSLAP